MRRSVIAAIVVLFAFCGWFGIGAVLGVEGGGGGIKRCPSPNPGCATTDPCDYVPGPPQRCSSPTIQYMLCTNYYCVDKGGDKQHCEYISPLFQCATLYDCYIFKWTDTEWRCGIKNPREIDTLCVECW